MPATKFYYTNSKEHNLQMKWPKMGMEAQFRGGKFQTADPKLQELIEASARVADGHVIVSGEDKPAPESAVPINKGVATSLGAAEQEELQATKTSLAEANQMIAKLNKQVADMKKKG